jgi:adenylylsulfate kinase-like enzyme
MVIWLIGISGAGKSTQARRLQTWLEKKGRSCYLLDGDQVRDFFERDLGFSVEDRKANVKRIIFGAYLVQAAGRDCIVASISPFEELRQFARRKIPGYTEIYLKRTLKTCLATDEREVYRQNLGKTDLVGIDIAFEAPQESDLVIDVDAQSEEEVFGRVTSFLSQKYPSKL